MNDKKKSSVVSWLVTLDCSFMTTRLDSFGICPFYFLRMFLRCLPTSKNWMKFHGQLVKVGAKTHGFLMFLDFPCFVSPTSIPFFHLLRSLPWVSPSWSFATWMPVSCWCPPPDAARDGNGCCWRYGPICGSSGCTSPALPCAAFWSWWTPSPKLGNAGIGPCCLSFGEEGCRW